MYEFDENWMNLAIQQAKISLFNSEVPVGAVIVKDNQVKALSCNSMIKDCDPTGHAEINVIRQACEKVNNYRLPGTTIYVTLEPCAMCYGAIINARISRVVFGAFDTKTGACGSCIDLTKKGKCFNSSPEITGGVLEDECATLLRNFFKERRN